MAYVGLEFSENGLIGLVHSSWFTPLTREVFWPPYKTTSSFNKALTTCEQPDEKWKVSTVKRIFFECDDIEKAQKKLKKCEVHSDNLTSDYENVGKPKRIIKRKFVYDSSSESEGETSVKSRLTRPPSFQTSTDAGRGRSSQPTVFDTQDYIPSSSCTNTGGALYSQLQLNPTTTRQQSAELRVQNISDNTDTNAINFGKIFQELKKVREELKEVKALLKNSRNVVAASLPNDIPVQLPVETRESFQTLENYLSEEKANDLASYFSSLGGNGTTAHVNRILRLLMTDRLAKLYNFAGQRNNKLAFCNTQMKSVIIRAIQIKTPVTTQMEVENSIKTWLKHATQRCEKRKNC